MLVYGASLQSPWVVIGDPRGRGVTNGIRATLRPWLIMCSVHLAGGKDSETTVQRGRFIPKWGWVSFSLKNNLIDYSYQQVASSFLGSPFTKNSIVKRAWWGAILGWLTFWKVFLNAHEWVQSALKRFALVCGASLQSPWVLTGGPRGRGVTTCLVTDTNK